jgi:hypothetical protein
MTNWRNTAWVVLAYLGLSFLGTAAFGAAIMPPSWLRREPERIKKPAPGPIDPKPSGVVYDARELPYTFVLPSGFAPKLRTARGDVMIVPEAWLPTSAFIEFARYELTEDVSGMSPERLREFAPSVLRGWTVGDPEALITTAGGATAFLYRAANPDETHVLVSHRQTGVHVHALAYEPLNPEQVRVLREAARTAAQSMRFR